MRGAQPEVTAGKLESRPCACKPRPWVCTRTSSACRVAMRASHPGRAQRLPPRFTYVPLAVSCARSSTCACARHLLRERRREWGRRRLAAAKRVGAARARSPRGRVLRNAATRATSADAGEGNPKRRLAPMGAVGDDVAISITPRRRISSVDRRGPAAGVLLCSELRGVVGKHDSKMDDYDVSSAACFV